MAKKKIKRDPTLANWMGDEVKRLPPSDLAGALDSVFADGPSPDHWEAGISHFLMYDGYICDGPENRF